MQRIGNKKPTPQTAGGSLFWALASPLTLPQKPTGKSTQSVPLSSQSQPLERSRGAQGDRSVATDYRTTTNFALATRPPALNLHRYTPCATGSPASLRPSQITSPTPASAQRSIS